MLYGNNDRYTSQSRTANDPAAQGVVARFILFALRIRRWGRGELRYQSIQSSSRSGWFWPWSPAWRFDAGRAAQPPDWERRHHLCPSEYRTNVQTGLYCGSERLRGDFLWHIILESEALAEPAKDLIFMWFRSRIFRA